MLWEQHSIIGARLGSNQRATMLYSYHIGEFTHMNSDARSIHYGQYDSQMYDGTARITRQATLQAIVYAHLWHVIQCHASAQQIETQDPRLKTQDIRFQA